MINRNDIIEFQLSIHIKDNTLVESVIVDIVLNEIDEIDDVAGTFRRLTGVLIIKLIR
jgi:hypothetical protein